MSNIAGHYAQVKGIIRRKIYELDVYDWNQKPLMPLVRPFERYVEDVTIWNGVLNLPPLSKGDRFYINELGIEVVIKDVLKTSDSVVVYSTSHTHKTLEDDKTEESLLRANEGLEEYLKRRESISDGSFFKNFFKK